MLSSNHTRHCLTTSGYQTPVSGCFDSRVKINTQRLTQLTGFTRLQGHDAPSGPGVLITVIFTGLSPPTRDHPGDRASRQVDTRVSILTPSRATLPNAPQRYHQTEHTKAPSATHFHELMQLLPPLRVHLLLSWHHQANMRGSPVPARTPPAAPRESPQGHTPL